MLAAEPTPIVPESSSGSPAIAFVVGAVVAGFSAFGWAWFTDMTGRLFGWPAIIIGVLVGLVVRLTGGPYPMAKSFIGTICGALGIGGGLLLILYQLDFDFDLLAGAIDITNLAFLFIGLSLARSFSSGKKSPLKQMELMRQVIDPTKKDSA